MATKSTPQRKVVLITGCSEGGVGFALCNEYARRGCKVYATARRLEAMESLSNPLIQKLTLDVTNPENIDNVVNTVIEREGQIDILVNNAGAICAGALMDVPIDLIKRTYEVNLFAPIRLAQAVFPHMAARKVGTIVNIGSVGGEFPTAWNGAYSSSKAAVHNISDVLYQEYKPFGIHVTCVALGSTRSKIAETQMKNGIQVPENSLYKPFTDAIINRVWVSQSRSTVPAEVVAKSVVAASLSSRPPRFIWAGGLRWMFRLLAWFPKTFVLNLLWRSLRGQPTTTTAT